MNKTVLPHFFGALSSACAKRADVIALTKAPVEANTNLRWQAHADVVTKKRIKTAELAQNKMKLLFPRTEQSPLRMLAETSAFIK